MAKGKREENAKKRWKMENGGEDSSYGWAMAGQMRRAMRRERDGTGMGTGTGTQAPIGYQFGHGKTGTGTAGPRTVLRR